MSAKPGFTGWTSEEYDNWQNGQLKPMPEMTDQERWIADFNTLYHDHGFSVREAYFALGASPDEQREFEAAQRRDRAADYAPWATEKQMMELEREHAENYQGGQ